MPNQIYSFGYKRVETLTGFINALLLVFASYIRYFYYRFAIVWEAIIRLIYPEEINPENMLTVSILGLLVNIVGIFAFDHGGMGHGHQGKPCSHSHSHIDETKDPLIVIPTSPIVSSVEYIGNNAAHLHSRNSSSAPDHTPINIDSFDYIPVTKHDYENITRTHDKHYENHAYGKHCNHSNDKHSHYNFHKKHSHNNPTNEVFSNPIYHGIMIIIIGMFLHILADALGSIGVIISCVLIRLFDWRSSDPICSIFIALLTLISVWPLLLSSCQTLLQRTPTIIVSKLTYLITEV
jgi:zinc transporter 5/7